MEGYCVKCKSKKEMTNPRTVSYPSGRSGTKGQCPTCGVGMFTFKKPS